MGVWIKRTLTQWLAGRDYQLVRSGWLGPFAGRRYETLEDAWVDFRGVCWTRATDVIIDSRGSISRLPGTRVRHTDPDSGRVTVTWTVRLYTRAGYRYDGPSGPTFDDRSNMRGACYHDRLYGLLAKGALGPVGSIAWEHNRRVADELLGQCMIEDGACTFRARYYVWAVKTFGRFAAK